MFSSSIQFLLKPVRRILTIAEAMCQQSDRDEILQGIKSKYVARQ